MKVYLVYEKYFADWSNGKKDNVLIECAFKKKRRAVKKAKELIRNEAKNFYFDVKIQKKRNPFKRRKEVKFYKNKDKEKLSGSVVLEEIKLVA